MMIRLLFILAVVLGICLACAIPAGAIPVFARKYGFQCTMCHTNFPRLNDYGVRYRLNGYQLPGRENEERTVFESPAPFAARTSAGYNYDKTKNGIDVTNANQFQIDGLDLLSGGLFDQNVGYIMVYLPELTASRGVVGQSGTLEMANVVFSNIGCSKWLNVRAGRLEGAYLAFSDKRRLSVSPYDIYEAAFPTGLTQTGLEVYGYRYSGLQYYVGWVDGFDNNNEGDPPSDVYVRVANVFGRGEGQTAGQRIGLLGYFGKARPDLGPGTPRGNLTCYGADASLNFQQINLSLQYIWASNDGAFSGTTADIDFSGGFAEVNYFPADNLALFGRYGWVDAQDPIAEDVAFGDENRWVVGGRYYITQNLALHIEYSRRRVEDPAAPSINENFFTTRLDFAF